MACASILLLLVLEPPRNLDNQQCFLAQVQCLPGKACWFLFQHSSKSKPICQAQVIFMRFGCILLANLSNRHNLHTILHCILGTVETMVQYVAVVAAAAAAQKQRDVHLKAVMAYTFSLGLSRTCVHWRLAGAMPQTQHARLTKPPTALQAHQALSGDVAESCRDCFAARQQWAALLMSSATCSEKMVCFGFLIRGLIDLFSTQTNSTDETTQAKQTRNQL